MNCLEIEQRLTEDLYGALADRTVRQHLEVCSSCERLGRELEEIELLKDSLSSRTAAPPDLPVRVARGFSRVRLQRLLLQWVAPVLVLSGIVMAGRFLTMPVAMKPQEPIQIDQARVRETWDEVGVSWESQLHLERPSSHSPRYLEVILSDPSEGPFIVQFPSTIEIRRTDPGREYLAYVSH